MSLGPRNLRETLAAAALELWRRLPPLDWALLGSAALVLILVLPTGLGQYLHNSLFFEPAMKLKAGLGLQPRLRDDVRVVMLDDQSLRKLGRQPTFAEWDAIAQRLFALGYEQAFLLGVHNLESEIGALKTRHRAGRFVLGAVVALGKKNLRTEELATIPDTVLTAQRAPAGTEALPLAENGYIPSPEALAHGDAVGQLNLLGDYEMPAAFRLASGALLPSLGLLAVPGLHWEGPAPVNANGEIPLSEDGSLYIDLVDAASARDQSVPVWPFFDAERTGIRADLPAKLRAEKLEGGKIAVLVPDAFTGSRFVDSPHGKVLSYLTVLSMLNSTLRHRFVYRPFRFGLVVLAFAPLLFLTLRRGTSRHTAALWTAMVAGTVAASVGTFLLAGWVLPCAHLMLLLGATGGVRAAFDVSKVLAEKMNLRRDLEMGTLVQKLLLPQTPSGRAGPWEYKVVFRPYGQMAGDWFQLFLAPAGAADVCGVVAIGDVVGKGPSAALITALIAGIWNDAKKSWGAEKPDIDRFIVKLHESIQETFRGQQNTTLTLAVLRPAEITLYSIASPHWVHVTGGGQTAKVRLRPCNSLGSPADYGNLASQMTSKTIRPQTGDVFVAYTDGVIDGGAAEKTFIRSLQALPELSQSDDPFTTVETLARQAGEKHVLPDDFTLLLVRRRADDGAAAAAVA